MSDDSREDDEDDASFRLESEEEEDDENKKARRRPTRSSRTPKKRIIVTSSGAEEEPAKRQLDDQKTLRRVDFDAMDDTIDLLPSQDRLTDRGGYAHTKSSRMKISQANAGNVPWNAGKNRSAQDKAKISAAVRARNRAVLLIKLQKLGMSEQEWWDYKKKLKLTREKVRKAKLAFKAFQAQQEKAGKGKKLKDFKKPKIEYEVESAADEDEDGHDDGDEGEGEVNTDETANEETVATYENFVAAIVASQTKPEGPSPATLPLQQQLPSSIVPFAKTHSWTPHLYDKPEISYSMMCPYGGPGGLICCETCAASYSGFLTKTGKDMERQHLAQLGSEVKELLEFTSHGKQILAQSVKVARRTPVPLHGGATAYYDRWASSGNSSSRKLKDPPRKAPKQAQCDDASSCEDEEIGSRELADLSTQTAMI